MATDRQRWLAWSLVGAGVVAVVAALYCFPPGQTSFYPRCAFHALTGLQCPGCGGLRAAHQLLHGHVIAAWILNPLVVLGAAGGFAWFAARIASRWSGRDLLQPLRRPWLFWAGLAGVAIFAVARNLIGGG